jgi:hypothetical protein
MVLRVNQDDEIYWKLCDANTISGDAVIVKSQLMMNLCSLATNMAMVTLVA